MLTPMIHIRRSSLSVVICALFLCFIAKATSDSSEVSVYLTSCDGDGNAVTLLEPGLVTHLDKISSSTGGITVTVDTSEHLQDITGYGAGLPQSSAYVLHSLKENDSALYESVMQRLFNASCEDCAGLSILRIPLGSCDFSMKNTSFDEHDADFTLSQFALDEDTERYIVPVLLDALRINPHLSVMGSPWSAPSWLKAYGTLLGVDPENTLIDSEEVYSTYAAYFVRTFDAFLERGISLSHMMLQNEPLFGNNGQYPGMFLSPEQATRLGDLVRAALDEGAGRDVKLLAYDHNWDEPSYPLTVLGACAQEHAQAKTRSAQPQPKSVATRTDSQSPTFDGTAWHCYAGDMGTALDQVGLAFPDATQHITECTGSFPDSTCDISRGMEGFGNNHEWDMQNVFLGAAGHGSSSGVKWVVALDEHCGPVLPGVEYTFGRPLVSIPSGSPAPEEVRYNQDYWTTAHMARFITPGSVRVQSTVTTAVAASVASGLSKSATTTGSGSSYLTETFKASSGQLVTLVMNLDHDNELRVCVNTTVNGGDGGSTGEGFEYILPAWSTAVFQWKP